MFLTSDESRRIWTEGFWHRRNNRIILILQVCSIIITISSSCAFLTFTNRSWHIPRNYRSYSRRNVVPLLAVSNKNSTVSRGKSSSPKIMIISEDLGMMVNPQNPWVDLNVSPDELRPSATLTNGQCFNWTPVERAVQKPEVSLQHSPSKVSAWGVHDAMEWIGVVNQTVFSIRETPTTTLYRVLSDTNYDEATISARLRDYFQLNVPLKPLYQQWSQQDTKRMARIAERIKGCRILRQDPVECLFSFICSSNNNIPRITQILQRFREQYGTKLIEIPVTLESSDQKLNRAMYSFPRLQDFRSATEEDFRDMGLGYRAKYFVKTRDILLDFGGESWLFGLRGKDEDFVQNELIKLHGIGRKVADCVALFSLDQTSAIPVDVHVQHIACRDYDATVLADLTKSLTAGVYKDVGDIFRRRFSSYPGWAHSLLFVAELPSFRPALPHDMIEEMDEWKLIMQQKKAAKKNAKPPVTKTDVMKSKTKRKRHAS